MKYLGPILALSTLLSPAVGKATSLLNVGPLATVDDVVINVMVGNTLAAEGMPATPFFPPDSPWYKEFERHLMARVTAELGQGGVKVQANSKHGIAFNVFGGKFGSAAQRSDNFFMLQVSVCLADKPCEQERTVLGLADDAGLETALIEAAVQVVKEFSAQRAMYRADQARRSKP